MRDDTRLYSIDIRDVATEKCVFATSANWTEFEKNRAIAQIMHLAGPSDDNCLKLTAYAEVE